jgi:hypothetical protein
MDKFAVDKLHLGPRSQDELHSALQNFELKWHKKATRLGSDERISRF